MLRLENTFGTCVRSRIARDIVREVRNEIKKRERFALVHTKFSLFLYANSIFISFFK